LASDAYREYWDHPFLERMYLARYSEDLKEFWPSGGPHWDALALVHLPGVTQPGALLAEGKSYVAELFGSGTGAKSGSASRKRIEAALAWTQRELNVTDRGPEAWCGRLYQSANRLAHVCWLRSLGVRAWLVHLLFTGDPIRETTAEEWERAIAGVDRELGLTGTEAAGHVILPAVDARPTAISASPAHPRPRADERRPSLDDPA
jgi:hypothetical protein